MGHLVHFYRGAICFVAGAAFCVSQAQSQPASSKEPAEHAYKNLQVLKPMPADQLMPSMQFMSSSLGVHCDHCHVEGAFDKDDKKPKQQAREMMKMVTALNHNNFAGSPGITCYTCHRGLLRPRRTPTVAGEIPRALKASEHEIPPSLSADEILNRSLNAVGGLTALQKIGSEREKGVVELGTGVQFPVEITLKRPGMRSSVMHLPSGDSVEIVNGNLGWSLVPGRPLKSLSSDEIQVAQINADPIFISRIKTSFNELRVRPDQQIEGREVAVIRASNLNMAPVRLYFDKQSGLLVRIVRYIDSPLGRNPTQIDYSDYREISGTKLPFRWTIAQPQGRYTVQLSQIEVNVPLEDSRFGKPDVTPPSNAR